MHNKYLLSTPLGLLIITVLVGVFLNSTSIFATSASTATATVKVAASCTLTTSGGGNYSATVPNGTSAEIAGSTMSVSCNDAGGFALYAVGFSDSTVGNNSMIGASTNISTNTSGSNSYWAMKVNPVSGNTPTIENSFNNYHIIPDAHTKVASYNQSTSGSLAVTSTYKVNISSSQLAGNYLGKVKYTLVHPANEIPQQEIACDPGKICYNPNTNIVEGQMGKQSASNNASVRLYAPNFKKQDYGFAGWSDKYDYETNPDAHIYGPQETITAPVDISTNGLSLYAVWIKSAGLFQNWDCGNLATWNTTALTDERDGNTYAVAKLADHRCWMIENLRIDNSTPLYPSSTNNPLLPLTNIYDVDNPTTSNHLSPATDPTQNAWCASSASACINQSMLAANNTILFTNNTSSNYSSSSNIYNYSNYYNWYSATAGHSKNAINYSSNFVSPGDICPSGWYLPEGGNKSQEPTNVFWQLIVNSINNGVKPANYDSTPQPYYSGTEATVISNALRAYPNNFIYSGYVNGSSIYSRNSQGYYWTSSGYSSDRAYVMNIGNDHVHPGTILYSNYSGMSIRCYALPWG